MKKIVLIVGAFISFTGIAQTFSDNFDSYTAGSYMAQQSGGAWTTWSNAPGGTEDVLVSSSDAVSGANSVYFVTSVAAGGPADVVKKFSTSALNTGQFSMEFNIKVETGKAGYFNLQKNMTVGQTWALDCFFADNGDIIINNQAGLNFTGSYTQNVWFNFRMDINFNTNTWEVFIDDVSIGTFSNPENQIASIDIYPTDQNTPFSCGYFIDDFQYTITPYTLPAVNGAVTLLSFDQGEIAGASVTPKVSVRNLGTTAITAFDLDVVYNGVTVSQSVTGINLASLATTIITLTGTHTLIAGSNDMVATVSNVNGTSPDGDAGDDALTISIDPIVPALGKVVVGEEATGTWCQYCPRGAVFMDMMETKYPEHWAGIAVHNADPMVVTEYDAGIGAFIGGYPSSLVDRGNDIDPSVMEGQFLNRIVTSPTAIITNSHTWDAGTRTLAVTVSANFLAAANNNYKLAIVLTEDGVTGTGSAYAQVNAYAGGGLGPMGGYESLPNPVPASQMVYDHVARAIEPSFGGDGSMFPATVNIGDTYTLSNTFTLPATWDENKMHIIGLLFAPNNTIDNAGKSLVIASTASVNEVSKANTTMSVYPNPASTSATIAINLKKESTVALRIVDMSGKEIAARNYGTMNGASTVLVNTSTYNAGVYIVEMILDGEVIQKRLVVE